MSIQFNMNTKKMIEAVLWIIHKGESNMYNIFKILFAAEKYHLNKYGRPITGDQYIAMKFGTVPSWLYNLTKLEQPENGFFKEDNFLQAKREPNMRYLSISDVKALTFGFDEYAGLSFNEVEEKNHKEPAWQKNYNRISGGTPIPFEDLIEEDWLKEELIEIASDMDL